MEIERSEYAKISSLSSSKTGKKEIVEQRMKNKNIEIKQLQNKMKVNHDQRLKILDLIGKQFINLNQNNNSSKSLLSSMNEKYDKEKQEMIQKMQKLEKIRNQKLREMEIAKKEYEETKMKNDQIERSYQENKKKGDEKKSLLIQFQIQLKDNLQPQVREIMKMKNEMYVIYYIHTISNKLRLKNMK